MPTWALKVSNGLIAREVKELRKVEAKIERVASLRLRRNKLNAIDVFSKTRIKLFRTLSECINLRARSLIDHSAFPPP
jgi:hypothetical protein